MTSSVTKTYIHFFINYLLLTDAAMIAHLEAKTKAEAEEKDRQEVEAKTLGETAEKAARLETEEKDGLEGEAAKVAVKLETEEKDRQEVEAKTLAEAAEAEEQAPVETTMLDTIAEILVDTTTAMDTAKTVLINSLNTGLVEEEATGFTSNNLGMYQRD